jgi:uncharacterized protein (TIGR02145 family)
MKRIDIKSLYLAMIGIVAIFIASCEKEEDSIQIKKEEVTGVAQKGPFIKGTQVQMAELNPSLEQTGNLFTTEISSDIGSFAISDVNLSSNYVEFSASGYYFNEVSGELSSSQLTLYALSNISDLSTINVNIMTHLEKNRVEYLLNNKNLNFKEAKDQAQQEILAIFGIDKSDMANSETLTMTEDNKSNAIMLAVSIILQGNRTVGDFTELLANISEDIKQDGTLDDQGLMDELRNSTLQLDLAKIRNNLESRYKSLGKQASIPDFESYINAFLSNTSDKPVAFVPQATKITPNTATFKGKVIPGSASTEVVFEYGKTKDYGKPSQKAKNSPINGHYKEEVSVKVDGLESLTTYHLRIKATNDNGTVYSADTTFNTKGTVTDIDGNEYKSVIIGDYVWMAENLRTTTYNDGNAIPNVTENLRWKELQTGAYSWYNNDESNAKPYGALYNWHTVETGKLCPDGWRVPTDKEWKNLEGTVDSKYPVGSTEWEKFGNRGNDAGTMLKDSSGWGDQANGTNAFGFSALPGGFRQDSVGFQEIERLGGWWTSTESTETNDRSLYRRLSTGSNIGRGNNYKQNGYSVRCIKDRK